ncbi:hypothetical protein AYI68_g7195 [Smittium mucronatum]|uniref:Uncharacterized protein n=1 Tax=Smittium mucronatum TaxID=133383 RepID=A0A1R0GPF4_9FUNG|nr:hypothetical protein AYI68_g7195 [Smittium mucronatum]
MFSEMDADNNANLEMWSSKLVGKYIQTSSGPQLNVNSALVFHESDLPQPYRILKPDSIATMDFRTDRLNVNTDGSYQVKFVTYG